MIKFQINKNKSLGEKLKSGFPNIRKFTGKHENLTHKFEGEEDAVVG